MTINGLGRDTYGYPLGTMINYSQGTHSYCPVTASPVRQASSPVCAGRETDLPRYDGRMTTNSSTSRLTPPCACARPLCQHWAGDRAVELAAADAAAAAHLAACLGCHMQMINCECATPLRASRVASVFAACTPDTAL